MDDTRKDVHPSEGSTEDATPEFLNTAYISTTPTKRFHIIFAMLVFLITLLVCYQTRICTIYVSSIFIKRSDIETDAKRSTELALEVARGVQGTSSPEPMPAVTPHRICFGDINALNSDGKFLMGVINELLSDQNMGTGFYSFDGIPLNRTSAVIVLFGKLDSAGNRKQMGITEAGFVCSDDNSTLSPMGLTIREKPADRRCFKRLKAMSIQYTTTNNGNPQMTTDGRPRIALSEALIELKRREELKLTLLHEFMHAHGAPAYSPILNFVHDDLTYLPEYNEMIGKTKLDGMMRGQERALLILMIACAITILINVYLAARIDRFRSPMYGS